jgi:hypothetical protein
MCIELCADSQQDIVDVLSWTRLVIELASAPTAIGKNVGLGQVNIVEMKVPFASKHKNLFAWQWSCVPGCI